MKVVLNRNFSDLEIDGKLEVSPFVVGDQIEVHLITQYCPDLGCCEVAYTVSDPSLNEGNPFTGLKYFDTQEVNLSEWRQEWNTEEMITRYFPPE